MKILYHYRTAANDGQAVHREELIAAFRSLGHEVFVVGPARAVVDDASTADSALSLLRNRLPRSLHELLELAYCVPDFLRLLATYRRVRPDFVYERYNLFLLSGAWLKRTTNVPFAVEVNSPLTDERAAHGGLAWTALARFADQTVWRAADVALPVTGVLARYLEREGVSANRIMVVANGIDEARLSVASVETAVRQELGLDKRIVLGFTGFVREWHGLHRVVELLTAEPALHLLVVGDGPARASLERQAAERGVADRFTVTGVVPHGKVAWYVNAFDIALQPASTPWASPLKLFEYMALACAIVAPDQENLREVLDHGETALLFDPEWPETLSDAIRRLAGDPCLRGRLGTAARAAIHTRGFTWRRNAERILEAMARC
ncbi:D496 [uncultured Defluviicoccus sp.]|uniref:D496 n=1 Tax=metagenome TaxID=256318 RepID=A0A380TDL0_9ZZZZ|nr:D496 [uncultured Defluviicoccus sp.]